MAESRLHRWAQRKAQDKQQQIESDAIETPAEETKDELARESELEPREESESQEEPEEIELPPLESLGPESDYSLFMSPEVDQGLRKLALRKLFQAPFYNVRDGLNDYDEDFTTFEELGDIITSDMKFHQERKKAEREQLELEQERLEQESLQPESEEQESEEQEAIETLASDESEASDFEAGDQQTATLDDEITDAPELSANDKPQVV